jgi:hypothetical protein
MRAAEMPGVSGDEFVVDEGVSRYGLHRIHILRAGNCIDREKWIKEKVNGGLLMAVLEYEDQAVGMHHLRLYWKIIDAQGHGEVRGEDDDRRWTMDNGRGEGVAMPE